MQLGLIIYQYLLRRLNNNNDSGIKVTSVKQSIETNTNYVYKYVKDELLNENQNKK